MAEAGSSSQSKGRAPRGSSAPNKPITIGELVRELQAEFPDLSISKVRYLEDRGLISPTRTKGRYRKYARGDVDRLRSVLSLQRDEYLPLEVIRQRLERSEMGEGGRSVSGPRPDAVMRLSRERPRYALDELCESTGVDEDFVLRLIEYRLIDRTAESGPVFTEGDKETVRVCWRLARFDLEPRHLRILSSAAERGAALIEQIATPSLRSPHADRRDYAVEMIEDLGSLFSHLTQLLLRRELERLI